MDNAVALVQAYLHVNGYFTVTEFPVVEAVKYGGYKTATDLDLLAFRFPGAGRLVPEGGPGRSSPADTFALDLVLGSPGEHADMIIGEVKEGRAELNRGGRNPAVLRAALVRFGCCSAGDVGQVVERLLRKGHSITPCGHTIRLVAFGSITEPDGNHKFEVVSIGQCGRLSPRLYPTTLEGSTAYSIQRSDLRTTTHA